MTTLNYSAVRTNGEVIASTVCRPKIASPFKRVPSNSRVRQKVKTLIQEKVLNATPKYLEYKGTFRMCTRDNTVDYIDLQYANILVAIKLQIQSTNLFCKDGMV